MIKFFLQKYKNSFYLQQQKATSLVWVNLIGLVLILLYIIIGFIDGNIARDYVTYLILPLIFLIIVIITLYLVRIGKLRDAGNFFIISLVIAEIASVFWRVSHSGSYFVTYAGSYYYYFMLLVLASIFATSKFINIVTALLFLSNIGVYWMSTYYYSGESLAKIRSATIDFAFNLIVIYIFLVFLIKIFLKAVDIIETERSAEEKEKKLLQHIIDDVKKVITQLGVQNQQLKEVSATLLDKSQQQAATTEEIASTTEEINNSIEKTAGIAQKTYKLSKESKDFVNQGQRLIQNTMTIFLDIAKKMTFIKSLAEKTDLLAINAAIEAAHVGDEGEGFVVIANEIRKLSEMAKNISREVNKMNIDAQLQATNVGKKFSGIVQRVNEIEQFMEQVSSSANEEVLGLEQINQALMELSKSAQMNSSLAQKMVQIVEQLTKLSQMLQNTVKNQ